MRCFLVPVYTSCKLEQDFADAPHSKSAKSAATTVSYGIFSSENSYLFMNVKAVLRLYLAGFFGKLVL